MSEYIMAEQNGRNIPLEDKIFGINRLAKEMIAEKGKDAVVNATIGSLLDDNGDLIVLKSIVEALRELSPVDFADYAPIGGTPDFKKYVKKAAFGNYEPNCFTETVATPGGTGSIRNAISNYSNSGDKVLTSDWHWAPYNTIAQEIGRSIETYSLFDEEGKYNIKGFESKVNELLAEQKNLVIIINTPAHNPTGYSLTDEDWKSVIAILKAASEGKKIALVVDAAYIDFAGDPEEYRSFFPLLEDLPENILAIVAYSLSKTFTLYGMRCGAMICMTKNKAVADEFKRVCEYSSRGTWSNCTRASQTVLANVYSNPELCKIVDEERAKHRDMLIRRGKAFEEESIKAGLKIVPFDAGFFASVPCHNPDEVAKKLQAEGIFLVPFKMGLRVSIAAISEKKCRMIPKKIKEAME